MTDERRVEDALHTATRRLTDAQEVVGGSIHAGSLPDAHETHDVVHRSEDVVDLAHEVADQDGRAAEKEVRVASEET